MSDRLTLLLILAVVVYLPAALFFRWWFSGPAKKEVEQVGKAWADLKREIIRAFRGDRA